MNRKNVALFAVLVLAAVLVVAGLTMLGKGKEKPVPAEPAAVETPAAEPEETTEPEPQVQVRTQQRPQRQRAQNDDFGSDINRIAPMQGDLPTQEEAVDFAYNVLDRYRNGTPEEQERIRAGGTLERRTAPASRRQDQQQSGAAVRDPAGNGEFGVRRRDQDVRRSVHVPPQPERIPAQRRPLTKPVVLPESFSLKIAGGEVSTAAVPGSGTGGRRISGMT